MSRNRFRAFPDHEDRDDDQSDDEDDEDPGDSALGALLRHEPALPHRSGRGQRPGSLASRGVLEWVEGNRVWLVPYVSALFVVGVVLASVFFAPKPLPPEGYAVLGAFWLFAVGRGTHHRRLQRLRERELRRLARVLQVPERILMDEFEEFRARRLLPRGRDHDDA